MIVTVDRSELEPGAMLTGVVHGASGPVTVRAMWETQGKGNTDRLTVAEQSFAPSPGDVTFQLQLPLLPLSYDGHLLKIGWLVTVTSGGAEESVRFLVRRRT